MASVTPPAAPVLQAPGFPDQNQNQNPQANLNPQPAPNPIPPPNPFLQPNPAVPPAAPLTAWQVQPDPLPAEWAPPDNPKGTIPIAGFIHPVAYPSSPSPFVSVAGKVGFIDDREVWNLKTMKRVGVGIPVSIGFNAAVSPDGAYLAAPALVAGKKAVDVWNVANGKNGKIIVDETPGGIVDVDFAGADQVLTVKHQASESEVQIWNVKSGAEVGNFKAASQRKLDSERLARDASISLCSETNFDRIMVFDLTTGKPAGDLAVTVNYQFQGMGFSPDGKSFAALFGMGQSARLQTWDVATGQSTGEHTLDQVPQNTFSYEGQAVEWLQDGGLMLFGQWLVDPKSGGVYWKLPTSPNDSAARRFRPRGLRGVRQRQSAEEELALRVAARRSHYRGAQGDEPRTRPRCRFDAGGASGGLGESQGTAGAGRRRRMEGRRRCRPCRQGALGKTPIPLAGKAAHIHAHSF